MEKVIVITGGTSGIGLETANIYKSHNNTVVVISKNVETDPSAGVFGCDVSSEEQVKSVFEQIGKTYGKIDVLINCAGFGLSGATELLPTPEVKSLLDVNILGTYLCCKYALLFMHRGSKIINIGSAMAFFPLPFRTMYATSKIAVVTMSYGMRMELKNSGIGVCVVCPGDVKTNFTKNRVKNFETNDRYGDRIENATMTLDKKEDKRMAASKVAKTLYFLGNGFYFPPRVIVGAKYKVIYFLSKFFPTRFILSLTEHFFGGYKK